MTEVRPITPDETEDFLGLMCDVFELDYGGAYEVFFGEPMFDLDRKWALFREGEMMSILTTTPLIFGWGRAFGIAGVATRRDAQRSGFASTLLTHVLRHGAQSGEPVAMLFARDSRLYDRNGFVARDEVVRAEIADTRENDMDPILDSPDVERIYDAWASAHPDRLRRDARRWNYWRWNYRVPTAHGDGYVCHEPQSLREALFTPSARPIPVPRDTQWYGLRTMARMLEMPLRNERVELTLMCRHAPSVPQMFMTDQF